MHRFTATFDDDVFEAMRIAAKRDHRSITSLVISTMEKTFGRVSIDGRIKGIRDEREGEETEEHVIQGTEGMQEKLKQKSKK